MKDKKFLFIDGTNLYAGQYKLFGPKQYLNFGKFIEEIEDNLQIKFDQIYFYASYSPKSKKPTIKEKAYLKNEALFYRSVKEVGKVIFFTGYRSKTSGKEKEVDVKLTADIISLAFLNKYKSAYLLTGDADFLQALFVIKEFHDKKIIKLICLENKIMHKGAFYFPTDILCFNKLNMKFHQKQQIVLVDMNSEELPGNVE